MAEIRTGVSSVTQIDFSQIRMPILTVYYHPDDYPEECVMRVFDGITPTNVFMVKENIQDIFEDIIKNTELTFINRHPSDVKSLVGIWL